ncbi:hypothetical protein [Bowmanella dokdonensis]|uniref:Uncharacterized protein n=1 Tax=Bowmanella dokdonensis TaxID=751969 RepID=A0A939DSU1_9ALTE|nr:hypothetical protein [Bowmanella dokdonensis]MBN7827712.1 hypothetical protein [Bowmanella dokdonensis]
MKSRGEYLKSLVEANTRDDVVNIVALAEQLGCALLIEQANVPEKGVLVPPNRKRIERPLILLQKSNSQEENHTLIALLLADYILHNDPNRTRRFGCDTFFLRELRQFRTSRQLFLATRLAMPESVIEKVSDLNFDTLAYARRSRLLNNFINCVFHSTEVGGLLGMIDSLDIGPANLLRL